ncbi:MAG: diphthine--ammonia ligase [Candidatus Aenigmatarchaeota archaeon]
MKQLRLASLFSGAKDSTLALYRAVKSGHSVRFIVTIVSENPDSYMYHTPNTWLTTLQAEAMGVPAIIQKTKGIKEKELLDLKKALAVISKDIDGVVVGAIESRYQGDRVEKVCKELGLEVVKPLWHDEPEGMWEEMLEAGFEVMIVSVACEGLGKEWLGRIVDRKAYEELKEKSMKNRFHLSGEGGEFESLVLDCPMFRKKVVISDREIVWDSETSSGSLVVKSAGLEKKP